MPVRLQNISSVGFGQGEWLTPMTSGPRPGPGISGASAVGPLLQATERATLDAFGSIGPSINTLNVPFVWSDNQNIVPYASDAFGAGLTIPGWMRTPVAPYS